MVYGGSQNTGYVSTGDNAKYQPGGSMSPYSASSNSGGGYQQMGKGSKSPMPQQQSPMDAAKAQDWLAQQQYNRDKADKDAAALKTANDLTAQKTKTAGDIGAQFTAGQNYGKSQMGSLGFADTYGVMDRYNNALNAAKTGVPDTATDVGKYFNTSNMWQNAVNEATTAQRGKLNTEYSNFAKPGWQKQDQYGFADTADDAILNAIMGEQRGTAESNLKGNLARGTMSQGAYDYAMNQMNNQAAGSMSNLQSIGGGVLDKYRTGLGTTAGQYGDRITGYTLGQNVNLNDLKGQLGTQQSGYQGGMKGDIINALGDTKLFDLEKLISSAGVAQGAQNTPLAAAIGNQSAGVVDPNRTTGTTGIF